MICLGNWLFCYRNVLFPVLIAAGLLVAHPHTPLGDPRYDAILDIAGVLIGASGQGLRILTIGYEYIRRGGKSGRVYADQLVTGGVFAHSRNPLYVGNVLMFLGIAVMINDPWLYAIGVAAVLVFYRAIVAAEESFLANRFGETYSDYCQRVNRWWPDFRGFRHSIAGMHFNFQRVLLKEYNTTFAWLLAMLAVQVWQLQHQTAEHDSFVIALYAWMAILLSALYLGVKICKKRRIIQA